MRSIYVRVRVINRICMILHNPRILHIATERNHMIGLEKMKATTKEIENANLGSDSYIRQKRKKKKKKIIKEGSFVEEKK